MVTVMLISARLISREHRDEWYPEGNIEDYPLITISLLHIAYLLDDANFLSSAKTIAAIITLTDRSNLYETVTFITISRII